MPCQKSMYLEVQGCITYILLYFLSARHFFKTFGYACIYIC